VDDRADTGQAAPRRQWAARWFSPAAEHQAENAKEKQCQGRERHVAHQQSGRFYKRIIDYGEKGADTRTTRITHEYHCCPEYDYRQACPD